MTRFHFCMKINFCQTNKQVQKQQILPAMLLFHIQFLCFRILFVTISVSCSGYRRKVPNMLFAPLFSSKANNKRVGNHPFIASRKKSQANVEKTLCNGKIMISMTLKLWQIAPFTPKICIRFYGKPCQPLFL